MDTPWRTEPEIAPARQQYLADRRAVVSDPAHGIFPFSGIALTRADIEWLLITHVSANTVGPISDRDLEGQTREGLDLRGADLRGVDLSGLPLARLRGALDLLDLRQVAVDRAAACVHLQGADLRGADLREAVLRGVPLDDVDLSDAHLERAVLSECRLSVLPRAHLHQARLYRADLANADLHAADLHAASLDGANLRGARLVDATLTGASLLSVDCTGSDMRNAHLEGAYLGTACLQAAHLEGAFLTSADLDRADLRQAIMIAADMQSTVLTGAHLEGAHLMRAKLSGANLRNASLDAATNLTDIQPANKSGVGILLADIRWGGANLTGVEWGTMTMLADDDVARQRRAPDGRVKTRAARLEELKVAARANHQFALTLQTQGLSEDAARFSYRADVLQRKILWRQLWAGRRHALSAYLFSAFLALLTGYGQRMRRIVLAYVLLITAFACAYFSVANGCVLDLARQGIQCSQQLTWFDAVILSITAFHGRVYSGPFPLGSPLEATAALEAIIGLVVEGVFIAMLTHRFFRR